MNTTTILTGLLGLSVLLAPASFGQGEEAVPALPASGQTEAIGKVAQALASAKYLNAKRPYPRAKYYIYLFSASWCGPCQALKPQIVAQYAEMKKSGIVELILIGNDRDDASGRAYAEHYGCPSIMMGNAQGIPGMAGPMGIPFCIFVNADGTIATRGHGSMAIEWKDVITQYESQMGVESSFTPEAAAAAAEWYAANAGDEAEAAGDETAEDDKKSDKKARKGKKDKKARKDAKRKKEKKPKKSRNKSKK